MSKNCFLHLRYHHCRLFPPSKKWNGWENKKVHLVKPIKRDVKKGACYGAMRPIILLTACVPTDIKSISSDIADEYVDRCANSTQMSLENITKSMV
ncbi:hypothetical protein ACTXT7_004199 [Hymenolepis weldensis]